ncbi:MAG TPA: zf-HC2 domain-containing protein, partial [Pirellulaceae bacterium]|nr:zf-HC2 domain-containing protein [Pirellulaceae bacterium]
MKELLSAYFDDELASEKRTAVSEHLAGCDKCSTELAGFERLSDMARGLYTPMPPPQMWSQLEQQLEEEQIAQKVQLTNRRPRQFFSVQRLVAVAAALFVAFGLGWFGYSTWIGHDEHDGFTAEMGHYLEEFHRDPAAAQQFLLAKYEGQAVDAQQAVNLVGYRPAIADGMPEGYSVETTYVMKMPCCTCVQCLCKRSDGSTIVVFEHDDEEAKEWFGDRPEMSASCSGKQCSLVELDDRIAASWKHDKRHFTV